MSGSIMILGAGTMQIPAIMAAKKLGLTVLVVDGSNTAPGIPLADVFSCVDLKDRDGLVATAQQWTKQYTLDGVFTAGTDFSANVAYIAEQCGLPGHTYQAALNATDKARMRTCFQKYHVPSPAFVQVSSIKELDTLESRMTWPVVVKPVDNMGARGVVLVKTQTELPQAVCNALAYSASGQVIIEEFMAGDELSLDALVFDGAVHICGIADRHIFYPPYFIERGHTLPSQLDAKTIQEVIDVFTKGIHALGLTHGAAKGDIKITPSGVKIGEIAARLSGGYMSGWTYPYASGVCLTKCAIQLAIGQKPKSLQERCPMDTSAEWSFISIPGKVQEIVNQQQAKNIPYIKEMFLRVQPGQEVTFPRNNVEKCGNFIAVHPDRSIAQQAARQAAGTIFIRLEKANPKTEQFLFNDVWPKTDDLFYHNCDMNGRSIQTMQNMFLQLTGQPWPAVTSALEQRWNLAWQRGGLQGAVWFFDTYLKG